MFFSSPKCSFLNQHKCMADTDDCYDITTGNFMVMSVRQMVSPQSGKSSNKYMEKRTKRSIRNKFSVSLNDMH